MNEKKSKEDIDQTQYVAFSLGEELYSIDAVLVQEIIELGPITKIPHLSEYIRGVINLRGTIIPVIDLKRRFSMPPGDYQKHTCVIITEFKSSLIGLIVDNVFDVISTSDTSFLSPPEFRTTVRTDFIKGLLRIREGDTTFEGKLIIVLDIHKVLSDEEIKAVEEVLPGRQTQEHNEAAA